MKKHFNDKKVPECTQCYKCVRKCPAKAIKIADDKVYENYKLCIDCGTCSKMCKKDIHFHKVTSSKLSTLLKNNKVIALLDISFFITPGAKHINQIEEGIKKAGFAAVETTFEATALHQHIAKKHTQENDGYVLNNDCIAYINYIRKFKHDLVPRLAPYLTAVEIASVLTKEKYPEDHKVMLITNCFADFTLVDNEYVDFAITAKELHEYFEVKNIEINKIKPNKSKKVLPTIEILSSFSPNIVMGTRNCKHMSEYISQPDVEVNAPINFYICDKSCFGSGAIKDTLHPYQRELNYARFLETNFIFKDMNIDFEKDFGDLKRFDKKYMPLDIDVPVHTEEEIKGVLDFIEVNEMSNEYNCNACGYETCRNFAESLLNDMATYEQCQPYLSRINKAQAAYVEKMFLELDEAFSLTIPDIKLEKKLKTTPLYRGIYDEPSGYFQVTHVIEDGLYKNTINCLKLAADLKKCNVFSLIGVDKNTLVQTILYYCNAKTSPILLVGDMIIYDNFFEDSKEEAERSAIFAKKYYDLNDDVCTLIRYHNHDEETLPKDFPKKLLPLFRLFKIIHNIGNILTTHEKEIEFTFEFIEYKLFITKIEKQEVQSKQTYIVDLYREQDFKSLLKFLT